MSLWPISQFNVGVAVLGRFEILRRIESGELVVDPLRHDTVRENGLDLRIGAGFAVQRQVNGVVRPCEMSDEDVARLYEVGGDGEIIVPPGRFVLVATEEYVKMPSDVVGLVNLRSTLARYGLFVPPTVVDAGFEGQIVVELVNASPNPIALRRSMRFLHLILVEARGAEPYNSTYRGQRGVRLPKGLRGEC